jgi:hypothetical protein
MHKTIAAIISVLFLPLVTLAVPAQASAYTQVCSSASECVDAAGGGPFVEAYSPNQGSNEDYVIKPVYGYCNSSDLTTANCGYPGVPAGHIVFQMQYAGGGTWNDECAGDEYNSPGDSQMSLDPCGGSGASGAGWGTVFWGDSQGCPAGYSFYNSFHWKGDTLGIDGNVSGVEWDENGNNGSGGLCIKESQQSIVT